MAAIAAIIVLPAPGIPGQNRVCLDPHITVGILVQTNREVTALIKKFFNPVVCIGYSLGSFYNEDNGSKNVDAGANGVSEMALEAIPESTIKGRTAALSRPVILSCFSLKLLNFSP
jgi:hypothetical protein